VGSVGSGKTTFVDQELGNNYSNHHYLGLMV
jgi:Ni2+-binding GTPase involved in maturation of urease and hydrogenase